MRWISCGPRASCDRSRSWRWRCRRVGVRATGVNVHQTGLVGSRRSHAGAPDDARVRPLRSARAAGAARRRGRPGLPGSRRRATPSSSLGRGGSDLTAVLLAAGLGAEPVRAHQGRPRLLHGRSPSRSRTRSTFRPLDLRAALAMADDGCDLVQRAALDRRRAQRHVGSSQSMRSDLPSEGQRTHSQRRVKVRFRVREKEHDMEFATRTIHAGAAVGAGHRLARRADLPDVDLRAGRARACTGASTTRARTTRRARGSRRCSPISKACSTPRCSRRASRPRTRCCRRI